MIERRPMSKDLAFGTQLLGQVEKTLNAILGRLLAGSGMTEPQWVALNVVLAAGEPLVPADAVQRVAAALKVDLDTARGCLDALEARGFLATSSDAAGDTEVNANGRAFHAAVRARVEELTGRLWGDVPADELAVAADVLNTVLRRSSNELARLTA
jgi:DNA-binding MarR family transcriptional regulator